MTTPFENLAPSLLTIRSNPMNGFGRDQSPIKQEHSLRGACFAMKAAKFARIPLNTAEGDPMSLLKLSSAIIAIAIMALSVPGLHGQETVDVNIPGFSFDPANLEIQVGTTVRWTNNHSVTHTTTSSEEPPVWDSGFLSQGEQFSFTFDTPGTYPYLCTLHPFQMQGEIVVVNPTDADDVEQVVLPSEFELKQNYPNPFNPETRISFTMERSAHVTVSIINVTGKTVARLLDRELMPGSHSVLWNGKNDNGSSVSSGVYFYTVKAGTYAESRKMLLLK